MSKYTLQKTDQEIKNERKSMTISIAIHALLLLLFLFFVIKSPEEIPQNEGVLIDFGNSKTGLGTNNKSLETATEPSQQQPEESNQTPTEPTKSEPQPKTPPNIADEVVTAKNAETPSIKVDPKKVEEQKKKEEEAKKKAIEEEQKRKELEEQKRKEEEARKFKEKMDKAFQKSGASGEGENKPGGNQGVLDGTPGAPKNDGPSSTGLGNKGIGYDLSGRKIVKIPEVQDASQKVGTVVVQIKVDKLGNVVSANYTSKGSTTTDAYLIKISQEAARKAKFDSNLNAADEQWGTMTFTYRVQ